VGWEHLMVSVKLAPLSNRKTKVISALAYTAHTDNHDFYEVCGLTVEEGSVL